MYVVIEGIDTSGKSTQIELLKQKFQDAIFTKEPGGTDLGKEIREILLNKEVKSSIAELFLFLADRSEHFEEVIKPHFTQLIISDRGFVSGIAYAMSNGINIELKEMIELNRLALNSIFPDLIILLKIDKETILKRLSKKSHDNIEKRGIEYLLNVQKNMQNILRELDIRYIEIDASKKIEEIHNIIMENIK